MTIGRLPTYPSTQARRQFPPSQLASLYKTIASTLAQTISLPPTKRDAESCRIFVQSYARDASLQALHTLIWGLQDDNKRISRDEEMIHQYILKLAESISSSLDLQTLLDLSIGYSQTKGHKSRLKAVFTATSEPGMPMHDTIAKDLVPSFTLLLSPQSPSNSTQGLYAVRKTAHCILSFLRASPPSFIRHFAHSKDFVLSLAHAYETSLTSVATSYGGINALQNAINRSSNAEADEWEKIWVDTKVALIDSFHIVLGQLLEDLSISKGRALGFEAERTFDIVFALLEQSNPSRSSPAANNAPLIPFLNRSLLADYQQSYSLSKTLASALKSAEEKDARLDIIESTLAMFDSQCNEGKDPGALKIVLHSYGLQRGIVNHATRPKGHALLSTGSATSSNAHLPLVNTNASYNKGKGKAEAPALIEDPELDVKVTQILDVLPDLSPFYVRLLLGNERYKGDLEQVLSALLEGRAPTEEELNSELEQQEFHEHLPASSEGYDISQRRNIFEDQEFDLAQLTIGKKDIEEDTRDRSHIDQMKADILRRAEAMFEEEDQQEKILAHSTAITASGQNVFDPEDELEEAGIKVKVMGDGEESDESDIEAEAEDTDTGPETIIELAWMRDPKVFSRDAATRRSKTREQLRKDTGWTDEQIEGWKIMLDRDPKAQEKVRGKHEFRGNQPMISSGLSHGIKDDSQRGGRGRGRGRGRGGSGGNRGGGGENRGGGGRSTPGPSGELETTRERSSKDKHKASRGNHNRKRGHDKKMARGMGPTS